MSIDARSTAMQFGLYLVKKGVITPHQFAVAVDHQTHKSQPLGELAVDAGMISLTDLYRVLREQAKTPNGRFGDAAVSLGLLSSDQVEELLLIQQDYQRPLGDILVELGVLPEESAAAELSAFRRHKERGLQQPLLQLENEPAILAR